jgi:uncharacterized protein (TIGR02444 family)
MTDTETETETETETKPSAQGSPFWRFSLKFYRQPGVADACIALQEQSQVDVNLLLYLLWHAGENRSFAPGEIAALESRIGPWRDATVIPLRAVRRALKVPPALVAGSTAEVFRNKIKAVELEAERLQQEAMYELAQAHAEPLGREAASPDAAARANVAAYATMLGTTFSAPAVDTLLAAFMTMHTGE